MKKSIFFIITGIIIIMFLLNSQIVLDGASLGLVLWFQTIVPTLLPFAILSSILLDLHAEAFIAKFLSPFSKPIFGLSPAGNYVLFIGLLCGYPLGAKTSAQLIREGRLSTREGQYLMNFCNNLSPAFIISFVCGILLNNTAIIPKVLLILYGTPIVLGILSRLIYLKPENNNELYAGNVFCCSIQEKQRFNLINTLDRAIINASETLLKLGAYIIIFAIFSNLIEASHLPGSIKTFLSTIVEVTNGCKIITSKATATMLPASLLLPTLLSLITFGGIAGIAQTAGMLHDTNLSLKQYIIFRLTSSAAVFIITYILF